MISGGNAEDFPRPWRLMSDEEPREVTVAVHTWSGLAPGASHFHVDVRESDDAIWDEDEGSWRKFWKYGAHKGRVFYNSDFSNLANARKWARMIIEENFSGDKYDVTGLNELTKRYWTYQMEGD